MAPLPEGGPAVVRGGLVDQDDEIDDGERWVDEGHFEIGARVAPETPAGVLGP